MSGGIARVGSHRHLQSRSGLVKLALSSVDNGKIVVGLGQFGIVFG